MSNVYAMRIYGSEYIGNLDKEDLPLVKYTDEVGFHDTYDQTQDYIWWGVEINDYHGGFNPVPSFLPEKLKEKVDHAYEKLSPELKKGLNLLDVLILVGHG